jgi:hypothetical protein
MGFAGSSFSRQRLPAGEYVKSFANMVAFDQNARVAAGVSFAVYVNEKNGRESHGLCAVTLEARTGMKVRMQQVRHSRWFLPPMHVGLSVL